MPSGESLTSYEEEEELEEEQEEEEQEQDKENNNNEELAHRNGWMLDAHWALPSGESLTSYPLPSSSPKLFSLDSPVGRLGLGSIEIVRV